MVGARGGLLVKQGSQVRRGRDGEPESNFAEADFAEVNGELAAIRGVSEEEIALPKVSKAFGTFREGRLVALRIEQFFEPVTSGVRVGFAFGGAHDLAHEEAKELLFATAIAFEFTGIGRKDFGDGIVND